MTVSPSHLDLLEAESIHIFREAAAQFRKPVLHVFDRQGFDRPAAPRAQGVLSAGPAVSAAPRRHDVEVQGDDRVPRPNGEASSASTSSSTRTRTASSAASIRSIMRHRSTPTFLKTQALKQALDKYGFRRRVRRRPPRRRSEPRQGTRLLVPRFRPSLGSAPAAPRDVAPVERPPRHRRDGARFPDVELDREGRLALHPARKARSRAALLRRRTADDRAQRPTADAGRRRACSPGTAKKSRCAKSASARSATTR